MENVDIKIQVHLFVSFGYKLGRPGIGLIFF